MRTGKKRKSKQARRAFRSCSFCALSIIFLKFFFSISVTLCGKLYENGFKRKPVSKGSEAADAEGASSSNKAEIIKGLNEDLAREYKAIIQYVVFSSTLKGAEYGDIAEQLKVHASQELAHALEVARQIDYLGGDPTVSVKDAEYSQDSKRMLEIDLKQEQETIKSYRERIRQAERSGEFALSEALRDIIKEEQDHEIDLKDALGLR
jgi:bacterioferritin